MVVDYPVAQSRQELLDHTVQSYLQRGYRVVNSYGWTVTMERGHRVNHLLHFLIGLVTVSLWWFVWIGLIVFNRHRIITISVDEWMNIQVRRA